MKTGVRAPPAADSPSTSRAAKPRRRCSCFSRSISQMMGREIDHDQPAAGRERPRRLALARGRDCRDSAEPDARWRDRPSPRSTGKRVNVALAQLHIAQTRLFEARPRHAEHGGGKIDADRAFGARREQLQHAPGPAADVEQASPGGAPSSAAARIAASTSASGACRPPCLVPDRRMFGEILSARARRGRRGSPSGARGRRRARDRRGSSRARTARASAAAAPFSGAWKKAQAPSRRRSTRPASSRSLRWRDTRGCDWPRIVTNSLTASSRFR